MKKQTKERIKKKIIKTDKTRKNKLDDKLHEDFNKAKYN